MTSSTYQAPNQERQPSGVGAGSYKRVATVPCRKVCKTGEGGLAILAERQILVRPEPLEPGADVDLMTAL